jgi:uncharacterized protein YcbK (DUF882 family)
MRKLSKNIRRQEVACHCGCGFDTMDFETIMAVQHCCNDLAREHGLPRVTLHVTSGARCMAHNANVGGALDSQHTKGRAMDIKILEVSPDEVYAYFIEEYPNQYGIGKYKNFTHIDTRSDGPARW